MDDALIAERRVLVRYDLRQRHGGDGQHSSGCEQTIHRHAFSSGSRLGAERVW
jgi:hypothetical protein